MKKEVVIIGGGVAGLCAGIRLTELGIHPLIIEAGSYPSHKVCGEFFSPECVSILRKWNIHPIEISRVNFHSSGKTISFTFPEPAGSLSHFVVDPLLAEHGRRNGTEIRTNTRVSQLFPSVELCSGERVQTDQLIVATGRIPQYHREPPKAAYIGFKAHFENVAVKDLEMFAFPGAYLGICPIEEGKCNVACLASADLVNKYPSHELFLEHLTSKDPLLSEYLTAGKNVFSKWMMVNVPQLGIKKTPDWSNAYFIGDAAGTIPPATGRGLSLGIQGGILAAEYAARKDVRGFKKAWKRENCFPIFWGKCFHQMITAGKWIKPLFFLADQFPFIRRLIYNKLH